MTESQPQPGRPRSFDKAIALDQAMHCFWANGYQRTNYERLEQATGLHRQSLRYAFGDKAALFVAAVRHYLTLRNGELIELLDKTEDPLDGLAEVFRQWTEDATGQGCLTVNTLGELGAELPEAQVAIARGNQALTEAFTRCLKRAETEGKLRAGLDPKALAHQAAALGDGLILRGRGGLKAPDITRAFEQLLIAIRR